MSPIYTLSLNKRFVHRYVLFFVILLSECYIVFKEKCLKIGEVIAIEKVLRLTNKYMCVWFQRKMFANQARKEKKEGRMNKRMRKER